MRNRKRRAFLIFLLMSVVVTLIFAFLFMLGPNPPDCLSCSDYTLDTMYQRYEWQLWVADNALFWGAPFGFFAGLVAALGWHGGPRVCVLVVGESQEDCYGTIFPLSDPRMQEAIRDLEAREVTHHVEWCYLYNIYQDPRLTLAPDAFPELEEELAELA